MNRSWNYWSEPELERFKALVDSGARNQDIADILEAEGYPARSADSIRMKRHSLRLPNESRAAMLTRVAAEGDDFTVFKADTNEDEPIGDLLDYSIRKSDRAVARAKSRPYARAQILTQKPIGIAFISDQHITMDGPTDMRRMMADAELIQRTPGMYCVLGGDGINNHIKHRSAMINSASSPKDEWRVYNHYLSVLGFKTLGIISGNHDDWSVNFAGIDMVAHLAKNNKVHYSPDELVLTVELIPEAGASGQEYVIKVRHQYRYSSTLNLLHTVKRMYDQGGDTFDIGVVCHHHDGAFESFPRHGMDRYAFRPGSYQVSSKYSRAIGFNPAIPTCPTAILWPDQRVIVPFRDVHLAALMMGAIREKWDELRDENLQIA